MFLLIYFLIGVAYMLFAVRHMDSDDIELIRDVSAFGAVISLWLTLCWPVLAVGSLLRLLSIFVTRNKEGGDDDPNE